ncbi:hypothetical protein ABFY60_10800 [Lysinibacillus pakistanensis]|uniref:hypothetical protein n=1 Tax=Lysinibacillus pakistanensis TaxID=759811 RepID=UPI003D2A8B8D
MQETLDEQAEWNKVVTVNRKDLQLLIKAYEQLRDEVKYDFENLGFVISKGSEDT